MLPRRRAKTHTGETISGALHSRRNRGELRQVQKTLENSEQNEPKISQLGRRILSRNREQNES